MIHADVGRTLEDYVTTLVESGRYGSTDDVLREGIRLVQERETHLLALDRAIARGVADSEAGRGQPIDEIREELAARYRRTVGDAA